MRTTMIGDLEVSVLGLGCNNFGRALDLEGTRRVVDAAIEAGVDFFDTSDNYGNGQSEGLLGEALGSRRTSVVVATKFGMPVPGEDGSGGASPEYVGLAARRSLARLGTDWIDLYQLHKPDPKTPISETLSAMWELVDQGLVREIGCSNLDASQLHEALRVSDAAGRPRFVSNQIEYSLLHRDPQHDGLTELAITEDVGLLPYYPLGSGMLTGKAVRGGTPEGRLQMDRYERFLSDENFRLVDSLRPFAAERGLSLVQVALGWLLAQPEVPAVTPGATKPEQISANVAAADWQPGPEDLAAIDAFVST